jgi:ATP-dependent 26S proteasome regulatory subunit
MNTEITKEVSEAALRDMCNDEFKIELSNHLKCRYPIFFITTNEEVRFIDFLGHYCRVNGWDCNLWNSYDGMTELISGEDATTTSEDLKGGPLAVLDHIINEGRSFQQSKTSVENMKSKDIKGKIYVLLDFFRFIQETPDIERRLKTIASLNTVISVIITGPYYKTTDVLENLIPVLDFPYPNNNEIKKSLYDLVGCVSEGIPDIVVATKEKEEVLINSVSGLTLMEAETAFSKSIVSKKGWHIPTILEEKKQIINKNGLLEYFDRTVNINDVGGLKNLVNWIKKRKNCFSKEAEEYGLRKPRGILLIGYPGSGKSYAAKAISGYWELPLLRMDFGKLFQSYVGDSERNARSAIKIAEAVSPCVLWIDEIEKAISGVQSSGRLDSGVTSRVLSTFLTWMQEKESPVFVVATANNHESIPSEFLRAGRFDEIFFVDLPNQDERLEIFEVHLRKRNLIMKNFNVVQLSTEADRYSGAEIEKAVEQAMLIGFDDGKRAIDTSDVLKSLKSFYPLSKIREGDFDDFADWAEKRCIKANSTAVSRQVYSAASGPKKDLDIS